MKSLMHDILKNSQIIAVVGHSDKPHRTSYSIAKTMRKLGYTIIPVNPTVSEIDGQISYASLEEVPTAIDIVNVFRRSEHLLGVVEEAIAVNAKAVWAQLGVHDAKAVARAKEANLPIITDTCIKVAYYQVMD